MLGWLRGAPGCPIGAELDPEAMASVRAQLTGALADPDAGPSGPVLGGLRPGVSSREDVARWSDVQGLQCGPLMHECRGALFGAAQARVSLRYAGDRLLDVEVSARTDEPDAALRIADAMGAGLGRQADPWRADGALGRAPLSQRRREYRFDDLRAEVRATNLGARGFLIRGFAQSLGS
ncbi:MAG: hypothetical protein ACE37F_11535 [Nannocystaceae bacterium]|nr:hypothetical protein [bacterium]